ncbi:MAG: glycoside hydrolase family 3 C-terminal domain-containing protein, partial [Pseudomonadales bacterium]|nr:glycoside hydrolase family 3 C-terminal domain-containing protein [Pseudomonadales bacterium]
MLIFLLVLILLGLLAYLYACHSPRKNISPSAYPWQDKITSTNLDEVVDDLMSEMTLREKVAQLSGDEGPFVMIKLGINVMLLGRFPNIYAGNNKRLKIPPISFSDGPRGIVVDSATCFPVAMARAASWDVDLEARVGDAIAQEARAVGANYFGGLCINLLRHPAWGRAQECYGEDPYLMGEMAVALLQSVQNHHVMVCAKHFALNSIENSRFYVDVSADEKTLHEVYLPHFKRCVDAGVASLMSAYNQFRGEYCGHNEYLLQTILREQWGFEGFVTSDWIWGVRDTLKPVRAGMDVEMPYGMYMGGKLYRALKSGEVDIAHVDRNVRRVVRTKLDYVRRRDTQKYEPALLACEKHRQLAQLSAEQSMVLLKNEGLLPLDKGVVKKVLVVGELADVANLGDHGSSRVSPPETVTFLQGLRAYSGGRFEVLYCDGSDTGLLDEVAGQCDVILIVAGYRHNDEGENLTSNRKPPPVEKQQKPQVAEGGDRSSLSLHQHDIALIHRVSRRHDNVGVVLVG